MKKLRCRRPVVIALLAAAALPAAAVSLDLTHLWSAPGIQSYEMFGGAVACADVTGDGKDDVIIGAPQYDDGAVTGAGRIVAYFTMSQDLAMTPSFTTTGMIPTPDVLPLAVAPIEGGGGGGTIDPRSGANFGATLVAAGDLDDDGYEDVIVGAPGYRVMIAGSLRANAGRVFIYFGGLDGLSDDRRTWVDGSWGAAYLGRDAAAGDLSGDGVPELILSAPGLSQVLVYRIKPFTRTLELWSTLTGVGGEGFGSSLAAGGDVDGDGSDDLAVGKLFTNQVVLYRGGAEPELPGGELPVIKTLDGPAGSVAFATSVALGDATGDGRSDLAVGDPGMGGGVAYLYSATEAGLGDIPAWTLSGAGSNLFGSTVHLTDDLDGAARSNLVVAAPSGTTAARVYLYEGRSAGLPTSPDWQVSELPATENFGYAVASGDVMHDAYDELLIASPTSQSTGQVFLYLGKDSPASAPTELSQRQAASDVEIPHGEASTGNSLRLGAVVRDPDGTPVRMQVEISQVAAPGAPAILLTSAEVESGQEAIVEEIPGLQPDAGYRWRARTIGGQGTPSAWSDFQGAGASEVDFRSRINAAPTVGDPAQKSANTSSDLAVGAMMLELGDQVIFSAVVADTDLGDQACLEVEVRLVGEPFLGEATMTSAFVASGAEASVGGPLPPGSYRWRARGVDSYFGGAGEWVDFGGNGDSEPDFAIGLGGSMGNSACIGSAGTFPAVGAALALLLGFARRRGRA